MIDSISKALESLLAENQRLLNTAEPDIEQWQEWGGHRAVVFGWLSAADFRSARDEHPELGSKIEEVLRSDALVNGKLKDTLAGIQRQRVALGKMRRAQEADRHRPPALALDRVI